MSAVTEFDSIANETFSRTLRLPNHAERLRASMGVPVSSVCPLGTVGVECAVIVAAMVVINLSRWCSEASSNGVFISAHPLIAQ